MSQDTGVLIWYEQINHLFVECIIHTRLIINKIGGSNINSRKVTLATGKGSYDVCRFLVCLTKSSISVFVSIVVGINPGVLTSGMWYQLGLGLVTVCTLFFLKCVCWTHLLILWMSSSSDPVSMASSTILSNCWAMSPSIELSDDSEVLSSRLQSILWNLLSHTHMSPFEGIFQFFDVICPYIGNMGVI